MLLNKPYWTSITKQASIYYLSKRNFRRRNSPPCYTFFEIILLISQTIIFNICNNICSIMPKIYNFIVIPIIISKISATI